MQSDCGAMQLDSVLVQKPQLIYFMWTPLQTFPLISLLCSESYRELVIGHKTNTVEPFLRYVQFHRLYVRPTRVIKSSKLYAKLNLLWRENKTCNDSNKLSSNTRTNTIKERYSLLFSSRGWMAVLILGSSIYSQYGF